MVKKINKGKENKVGMDKDFFGGIKFGLGFILVISMLAIVSASGWHIADEILSGDFAGDYNFSGDVDFSSATVSGLPGGSSPWTTTNGNITYSGGNVGIGTSTPSAHLEVSKSGGGEIQSKDLDTGNEVQFKATGVADYVRSGFLLGDADDTFSNGALWVAPRGSNQITTTLEALTNSDATTNFTKRVGLRATTTEAILYSARGVGNDGDIPLKISTQGISGSSAIYITGDSSQNIGMGTTSPSAGLKLDVEGKLGAQELCDETGGNCFDVSSGWTVNSNAASLCANGEFLNGDGTCDAGYLDADGTDAYNSAYDTEAEIDAAVSNNGYSTGAHTTNTNAATLCAAGQFLNGDGTCDTITSYSTGHCTLDAECNSGNYVISFQSMSGLSCGQYKYACYRGHCRQQYAGDCACFVSGTQVLMQDYTTKNIEDIIIGDLVINELGEVDKVIELHKPIIGSRNTYLINNKVEVTADHPFLTKQGWKVISENEFDRTKEGTKYYEEVGEVGILEVGDILITKDGEELIETITENAQRPAEEYVYSFALENGKAYYADGYLVASLN